jgi:putative hydrolase of the HAD superfamily
VFGYVGILDFGREAITQAYKDAESHLNKQAEVTGYDTGMAERIAFVLDALGVTGKTLPSEQEIVELQKRSGEIRMLPDYRPTLTEPDLLETLQSLKDAGYVLGTLSNTGMGDCHMMAPVVEFYGFDKLFDVRLFSCEDGRAKPNPGLFRRMSKELDTEPWQVLHVGDNAFADCRATLAGLRAVLYAPKGEPQGNEYPFITSMKELLRYVQ